MWGWSDWTANLPYLFINKSYPHFTIQKRQCLENLHAAVQAVSINIKGLMLQAYCAKNK